jgi:hypothetical protein
MEELNAATVRNIEVDKGAFILPVLIEECTIPELIRHRKYADFKNDPKRAFEELRLAIKQGSNKPNAPGSKRTTMRRLLVFGVPTVLIMLCLGGLILVRLASGVPLPPYLQEIAKGKTIGKCSAENSAVQRFQYGWLVGHFLPNGTDYFYAVIDMGKNDLRWFRTESTKDERHPEPDCVGVSKAHLLRWGFRRWYCSKDELAAEIRGLLGEPTTLETAIWAQYQQWSEGLLVVGVPTIEDEFRLGKYASLVNIFLQEAHESASRPERGWGRFNTVTPYNVPDCKVYCNAVWYYAPTGPEQGQKLISPELEKQTGCTRKHSNNDFHERDVCSLCLD